MVTDFTFLGILSMAVGFAALGISIIIAHQQGKITDEIHESTEEQKKLLLDTRDFYASVFVGYVRLISTDFKHVISLYENNFKVEQSIIKKKNTEQTLRDYYDNDLFRRLPQIQAIELVKVFGGEIANKYWIHTAKLTSDMWQPYSDNGMALMMHSYKEQMFKLVELKNDFLPFCDKSMKEKEHTFQENYDLIEKTFLNASNSKKKDRDIN